MHVIATAGHVDHGKSTLVKALTGSDPDRLEEEHRRGVSIELGYCWTFLPPVGDVAFVDVPGHERFLPTMLSGVGPVPTALFVVAADDPWMPQAAEHLAALAALGVSRGVLAVTRSDLADPAPALASARMQLARTSLCGAPAVAVSGRTGEGLEELRHLLAEMVASLEAPDPGSDVRLWLDRCFHVRGAGTVVTGTLQAGRISVGDRLAIAGDSVRVRGLESLGKPVGSVQGVARVALNLAGAAVDDLDRGSVLVTPHAWQFSDLVDVRISTGRGAPLDTAGGASAQRRLPQRPILHIGAASVSTHCRPLAGDLDRLRLDRALPLRVGDRALLRDPGTRQVWGVTVLDPAPGPLVRRGAAQARAADLASHEGLPDLADEVRRRGLVRVGLLRRIGVDVSEVGARRAGVVAGDWLISPSVADGLRGRLEELVREQDQASTAEHGLPLATAAQALDLPSLDLVRALVRAPMWLADGRVVVEPAVALPAALERALTDLERDLDDHPFAAPTAERLRELGLDHRAVGAASRAGRLLSLPGGVVLLPGAEELAATWLSELPQPFTTSQARLRLRTSRRVALPLLARLDRVGSTRRMPDDRRTTTLG